jgi:hypothetical protein
MKKKVLKPFFVIVLIAFFLSYTYAQKPIRVGTTAANFLEYGFGAAGCGMGEAFVSVANDLSSVYWNPAGLAYMNRGEVMFLHQPWLVDISTLLAAAGVVVPRVGTIAVSLISINYGEMEVTTLQMQEGTGETFTPNDMSISLSYGRQLATWFSFGASAKFISSTIRHTSASAFAVDLGVIIKTHFFSPTGKREDGMNLAMSISNYGTRMKYDGIDLTHPIDPYPNEAGNYADVPGQYKMQEWELPLIFRIGCSVTPLVTGRQRLVLSVDALHPNNNSESVNVGTQYTYKISNVSKIFLRAGYKALFMEDSQYGLSLGGGIILNLFGNRAIKLDYAFRDFEYFGGVNSYNISFLF